MSVRLSIDTVVMAVTEQVSCPLGEEAAILNLKNTVYYGLNPVGASVWKMLQQPKSVAELRDALLECYEVEPARCEQDLFDLLEKMQSEGLIQIQGGVAAG